MGAGNYRFTAGREAYVDNEARYSEYSIEESRYYCQLDSDDHDALQFEADRFEEYLLGACKANQNRKTGERQ